MNNNIKKKDLIKIKRLLKKREKTHPLSGLFTAEHYELTDTEQLIITFYECYLSNRFH